MERWYRATGVATRTIVRALDVRLRYTGLEHLPRSGPVVLASNHVSYPDFLWIGLAAHQRDRWATIGSSAGAVVLGSRWGRNDGE